MSAPQSPLASPVLVFSRPLYFLQINIRLHPLDPPRATPAVSCRLSLLPPTDLSGAPSMSHSRQSYSLRLPVVHYAVSHDTIAQPIFSLMSNTAPPYSTHTFTCGKLFLGPFLSFSFDMTSDRGVHWAPPAGQAHSRSRP